MNPACAGVSCEGKQVYSREIKVRLIRAGIHFEEKRVESREINWDTSGLDENPEFRCILFWQFLAIHRKETLLAHPDVYYR